MAVNGGIKDVSKDESIGAVMVVGGGISGMQSSLDLADAGFRVYLVESGPTIGGVMSQLDKTFPTNDCAMCIMAPKLVATGRHHNVEIITNANIQKVAGSKGNFSITLEKKPRKVNEDKCTGCGMCATSCPVNAPDEYNMDLKSRHAIYLKYPQAIPLVYTIDTTRCIGCGICECVCRAHAIEYAQEPEEVSLNVGSIILSPGFSCFDPKEKPEFGYGIFDNVVTSMEFERMLSATGPSGGVVTRPSDGASPLRVAFIQCVGSRDEKVDVPYCSSVCCMYSMKEAIIAKEHSHGMEATIFYMDLRAFGKQFEEYYLRAQEEYGIKFVRSRIADVSEDPQTNHVRLKFVEDGKPITREFDMVVLATGFKPPKDGDQMAKKFGIKLNQYGFVDTKAFSPLDTSKPGIFVSGAFAGPKDIPETVAQASGAAARASTYIAQKRNTLIVHKEYPDEIPITGAEEPRIGIFVCHCGINIGGIVDVPRVMEYAASLPNVVVADRNLYTCSQDTQEKMKKLIKEHRLNRVVVASCTPRTHEPLFRETCREAGLNPYLFEMGNIREHCSWVHMNVPEKATEKAMDIVRTTISKVRTHEPLYQTHLPLDKACLIIGGGLSGMVVANTVAEQGYRVHIVEKEKELGGVLRRIHYLPEENTDPKLELKELLRKIETNENITVHRGSTVGHFEGTVGNFKSTVLKGDQQIEITHGAVVVASGAVEYKPHEYLYGKHPKVITQMELEDLISKGGFDGKSIVMIQCVGARNKENPNCSRICCTEAMKNALKVKELHPKTEVVVLNKDIRTYGFRERFYTDARRQGVIFMRYSDDNLPQVTNDGDTIKVEFKDTILNRNIVMRPDYLVLSVSIRANPDNETIAPMLKIPRTKDGYFLEAHMKLRPVEFMTDGVFLCGLAHSPRFVDESISQAEAAAVKVTTLLSKDSVESEAMIAKVTPDICIGCGLCARNCEYHAIDMVEQYIDTGSGRILATIAEVHDENCKGCGKCVANCPSGAMRIKHYDDSQLLTQILAAIE